MQRPQLPPPPFGFTSGIKGLISIILVDSVDMQELELITTPGLEQQESDMDTGNGKDKAKMTPTKLVKMFFI